jgi:ABC-type antimicrobial peptide transport system permease subunit
VRAEVQAVVPTAQVIDVRTMSSLLDLRTYSWRVAFGLFGVLGALGALLAAAGVYALSSFIADQRSREMGIRAALGAGRERLLGVVLWDGVKVSAAGLTVGAAVALVVARLFRSQLFGISYADPATYLAVGAALLVLALAASARPAVRASGADPAVVLRDE